MYPQEKIQRVSREVLEALAVEFHDSYLGRASELIDEKAQETHHSQPPGSTGGVDWCKCGACSKMPNQCEDVCCLQNPCISQSPVRQVAILSPLEYVIYYMQSMIHYSTDYFSLRIFKFWCSIWESY